MADIKNIIEHSGVVTLCGIALDRTVAMQLVNGDEGAAGQLQAEARSIVCCEQDMPQAERVARERVLRATHFVRLRKEER